VDRPLVSISTNWSAKKYAIEAIEFGNMDPASILEHIELQIANVKEESFSRKEILEKVKKWLTAYEEESWLEEYNRDDNRYNTGRVLIWLLSVLRKLAIWLIKCQVWWRLWLPKPWHGKARETLNSYMMVSTFFLCLKSTPYYTRRKRKKDGVSGIRRNIFRVQQIEKKRIKDWEGRILQEVEDLKKNFFLVWQYIKHMIGRLIIMKELV